MRPQQYRPASEGSYVSINKGPPGGGAEALDPQRWYMLFVFALLMANQCLFWFTFSADPRTLLQYYPGLTTGQIDQLLNWGPLTFVPTVPFVSWLLTRPGGLRTAMRLNAGLAFAGCAVRLIPCALPLATREHHHWTLLFLHVGQILNGIAGPVLIAAPSRLSALWFKPGQRTTVTAVANASFVGAAIGFGLCPAVLAGRPDNVPKLLLLTLGLAALPLAAVLAYCPDRPARPPSAAVVEAKGQRSQRPGEFIRGVVRTAWSEPAVPLLMAVMALAIGVYDGWIGVLPQILTAGPVGWSPRHAGLCGMAHTFACIAGQIGVGQVADRCCGGAYRALLIIVSLLAALAFAVAAGIFTSCRDLHLAPIHGEGPDAAAAPLYHCLLGLGPADGSAGSGGGGASSDAVSDALYVLLILAGFLRTGLVPVIYELAAEVTYPVPEGTSAGVMVIAEHAALIVTLFIAPHVSVAAISMATLVALLACPLLLAVLPARHWQYRRSEVELLHQKLLGAARGPAATTRRMVKDPSWIMPPR